MPSPFFTTPNAQRSGLIGRTTAVGPLSEAVVSDGRGGDLERLASALGYQSIELSNFSAARLHDSIGIVSVTGGEATVLDSAEIDRFTESLLDGLDEKMKKRLVRSIGRMANCRAKVGINLRSGSVEGVSADAEEVVPVMHANRTTRIPSEAVVHLLRGVIPDYADGELFYLAGTSALKDNAPQRDANEVVLHLVVRRNQLGELSTLAKGPIGEQPVAVRPKDDIEFPNTVLVQAGVYRPNNNTEDAPLAVAVRGNISPQLLGEIADKLGYAGQPLAYQVFLSGETTAGTIHSFPKKDYPSIAESVADNFSDITWSGHAVASGVRFDSPYTENGHVHLVAPDGKNGGHWKFTEGAALVFIHNLSSVITARYDSSQESVGLND